MIKKPLSTTTIISTNITVPNHIFELSYKESKPIQLQSDYSVVCVGAPGLLIGKEYRYYDIDIYICPIYSVFELYYKGKPTGLGISLHPKLKESL